MWRRGQWSVKDFQIEYKMTITWQYKMKTLVITLLIKIAALIFITSKKKQKKAITTTRKKKAKERKNKYTDK